MSRMFLPVLLTLFMLGGCLQEKAPEAVKETESAPTVGVVNLELAFRDSEPGKAGIKFFEELTQGMQKELVDLQAEAQKDPENEELQKKMQERYMQYQQRVGAEEQNIMNIVRDLLQRSLDTYRESKKLLLIVGADAALSYDKTIDVTADIIVEMNKQKVEFTSAFPDLEAAPAKAAPADAAKPAEAAPADAAKPADAAPAEAEKPAEAAPKAQ